MAPERQIGCISAIAARMSAALDDKYVAGHFWKTLSRSLNWHVRVFEDRKMNSDTYRIGTLPEGYKTPTWSWASMNGSLLIGFTKPQRMLAEVGSYELDLVSLSNPMGQVRSATLSITAYLTPIENIDPVLERLTIWWDEEDEEHPPGKYEIMPLMESTNSWKGW